MNGPGPQPTTTMTTASSVCRQATLQDFNIICLQCKHKCLGQNFYDSLFSAEGVKCPAAFARRETHWGHYPARAGSWQLLSQDGIIKSGSVPSGSQ